MAAREKKSHKRAPRCSAPMFVWRWRDPLKLFRSHVFHNMWIYWLYSIQKRRIVALGRHLSIVSWPGSIVLFSIIHIVIRGVITHRNGNEALISSTLNVFVEWFTFNSRIYQHLPLRATESGGKGIEPHSLLNEVPARPYTNRIMLQGKISANVFSANRITLRSSYGKRFSANTNVTS